MDNFEEDSLISAPMNCHICLNINSLIQLELHRSLFTLFNQIAKIESIQKCIEPINICTKCFQELEMVSQFVEAVENRCNNQEIENGLKCLVCVQSNDLTLLPQNLLVVFQDLTIMLSDQENRSVQSCKKCLTKLQKISNFIKLLKENYVANFIKQEPIDVFVKAEPSDDEFVETPSKIAVKDEPDLFSFDGLEQNNNYIKKEDNDLLDSIKDEASSSSFENTDSCIELKGAVLSAIYEDQKNICKLEIESEGLQYDSKEMIKIDCPFCNEPFDSTRSLLNHMNQRFRCRSQKPNGAKYWKNLLSKVSKLFKCRVCLKHFSTVQKKREHIKKHFGKSCVVCPSCGKMAINRSEYFMHFVHHTTKQLRVKCKFCPKKFAAKLIYLKHLQNHKKQLKKTFRCNICSRNFSKKSFRSHSKKDKIECPYCPKQYCGKSQLSVHLRSHTKERPYECAGCYSSFSTKGNLIKHSRIHTGYKPYECKVCLKPFSRPDALKKHLLGVHKVIFDTGYKTGRKRMSKNAASLTNVEVTCKVCSKIYPSKASLTSHMRVHNKEKNFQCEICSKTFLYKGLLNGHMKTHQDNRPFICTFCPKSFIKRNDLTRHTLTHTKVKNFKCEICYEKFARKDVLRLHLRGHTGQRPYECENCFKSFAQKSNLTHHLKRCRKFLIVNVVD